jgi:exodeoxyribonuclease III
MGASRAPACGVAVGRRIPTPIFRRADCAAPLGSLDLARYRCLERAMSDNPELRTLRIASYNVNGVNGRLPRLIEWLQETAPDIVCLQELKTDDTRFPVHAIQAAGYGAIWHGQRSHHGVAILAKGETPIELRRGLPGAPSDIQTRYLEGKTKGIVVASIYLPNGNPRPSPNFDYKLLWFERLIRHAGQLYASNRRVVLAGDLNVVPTDFDIYNPSWWRFDAVMQPETRDAYRRLLAQGWIDAARALHPDERMYTFWVNDDAFRGDMGFRMDFLLLAKPLQSRLVETGVDTHYRGRQKASDHAPVWATIALGPKAGKGNRERSSPLTADV